MPARENPHGFPAAGLDDGVVRLRFRAEADLSAVVAAAGETAMARWTRVPDDLDLERARELMEEARKEMAEGKLLDLVIADARTDELLGACGVIEFVLDEQRCEVGAWLAPGARGAGAMSRAGRLLCTWLFDELGMMRIAAGTEPDNVASQALLERLGFQREGVTRSLFEMKGRRRDFLYYSLLPGELVSD